MPILLVKPDNIPNDLRGYYWVWGGGAPHYPSALKRLSSAGAKPAITPEEFEIIVDETSDMFGAWLDSIQHEHGADVEFWALEEFSGRPISTSVYFEVCVLRVVQNLLENRDANIVVICEYGGLAQSIHALARTNGISCDNKLGGFSNRVVRRMGGFLLFVLNALVLSIYAKVMQVGVAGNQKIDLLVELWLTPEMVKNGTITDRYIGDLLEALKNANLTFAFYPNCYNGNIFKSIKIMRAIKKAPAQYVLSERVLPFSDLVRAILKVFKRPKPKWLKAFAGLDITGIINSNSQRRRFSWDSITALMKYYSAGRLREAGFQPKALLAWDENQIVTKCGYRGFRENFPRAKLIGVRIALPLSNFHSMNTAEAHWVHNVGPDMYLVPGKLTESHVMKYYHGVLVKRVLMPRFQRFTEKVRGGLNQATEHRDGILIALPTFAHVAKNIINMVLHAPSQMKIYIKSHPDSNSDVLHREMTKEGIVSSRIELTSEDNAVLFSKIAMVISWQSSTLVEAICFGVPAIEVVTPYTVNLSPLVVINKDLWRRAYDQESFNRAVEWAMDHPVGVRERRLKGYALSREVTEERENDEWIDYVKNGALTRISCSQPCA